MRSEVLKRGAIDWLRLTGAPYRYRSEMTGQSAVITATLEQDIATVDDQGMIARGLVLNLNPDDIGGLPNRGDMATDDEGNRFRIDEVMDSPGYLTRVFVSPD